MLKFRRRLASADFLAYSMLAGPHPEGDLIVPVPLSSARLPLDTTGLARIRDTPPQSRLP